MASPSVIVIEDEADLRNSVCAFLAGSGFDVRGAGAGDELTRIWAERPADILVIDVMLPGEDGFSIAARMRKQAPLVGIIMLTARGQAADRIAGLELGADNYLVKPLVLRELVAAIQGLARRMAAARPSREERPATWSFDPLTWALTAPNGISVDLTTAEFCLIDVLAASPGQAVSADALLAASGKKADVHERRSLETILSRLRRKVETATGQPLPVKAVRTVGYTFAAPLERAATAG